MSGLKRQRRRAAAFQAGLGFLLVALPLPVLHSQGGSLFDYQGARSRIINAFYENVAPSCRSEAAIRAAYELHVVRPLKVLDARRMSDVRAIASQAGADLKWTSGRTFSDPSFRAGGDFDTTAGSMAQYYREMKALVQNNIPCHAEANSYTAPTLNWTNHMPEPPYRESLSERPWVRDAMAADPEAASHWGLAGRPVAIPVYEAASGRMLAVDNPIPKNPFTPLGDLAKKNQEALEMLNRPNASWTEVQDAANFASKAQGKAYALLSEARLTKYASSAQRLSESHIAAKLAPGGQRLSLEEARGVVRDMISQTGRQLSQYSNLAVREIGETVSKLKVEWARAMERGDAAGALRAKTQLLEIRASMKEAAARLRNESALHAVFGRDDSLTLGRPVSPDARIGPVKPQPSTLQKVLDKGLLAMKIAYAAYTAHEAYEREQKEAEAEGRDPSYLLMGVKFLDEYLGLSRAWETGRMAGELTMAQYLEQARREGRELDALEMIKAKMESLLHALGEWSNVYALGRSLEEMRELIKASVAEVDAELNMHREWLRRLEKEKKKPEGKGVPSLIDDSKTWGEKIEAQAPATEMDTSSKWSTVKVSEVSVSPGTVERGGKVVIRARISGVRKASMSDLTLTCFIDKRIVDTRKYRGSPGKFSFTYEFIHEVPENAAIKTYRVQVFADFNPNDAPFITREEREAASSSGETDFNVEARYEGPSWM
ncbi:MAG: hypothetical protein JXO51_04680 [Candidatus Aminicenantes bacterium]|nr:hypothetical protein [Candidatus Aminicenantes bacterium]